MAKIKLWSVFTDDMNTCIYTGSNVVERHHIFGGANREKSTMYGFVVPLRPDFHPNGVYADKGIAKLVDIALKQRAQTYYENYMGSREDFIKEFGRSWL